MKILFTGASSLTGMWFVEELAKKGHHIVACLRSNKESYQGLRLKRIHKLLPICQIRENCPFGSAPFLDQIADESHWDLFCHHAADVTDYKSPDFNPVAALANNTHHLKAVLQALKNKGCNRVLLSGSVFEQNEGAGSELLRAVSPYGLSKGITSEVFKYYAKILEMNLGKFVIPNPFGPYEEPRFTTYLIQTWMEGKKANVNAPEYIRDNIPVSLLAKAYRTFAEQQNSSLGYSQMNPSFYVESQGSFTERFSKEMKARLQIPCEFELKKQVDFQEPRIRINFDTLDPKKYDWSEKAFWNELSEYYQKTYGK